jgi:hypothetical protein
MKGFIVGVVVTLAVLFPAVTKSVFAKAVDVTHGAVITVIDR